MYQISYYIPCSLGSSSRSTTLFHQSHFKLLVLDGRGVEYFTLQVSGLFTCFCAFLTHNFNLELGTLSWEPSSLSLDATHSSGDVFGIHSFSQRIGSNAFPVIGALFIFEEEEGKAKFFVRIFGATRKFDESLEDIFSDCQTIGLDFVPSSISSVLVPDFQTKECLPGAFLICGANRIVLTQSATTKEFSVSPDFTCPTVPPSIVKSKSHVLCCTMSYLVGNRCVSAYGCDDGSVIVNAFGLESRIQLDGPISCLCLTSNSSYGSGRSSRQEIWTDRPPLVNWTPEAAGSTFINWKDLASAKITESSKAVEALSKLKSQGKRGVTDDMINLVVGGATGFCVIFEDIERNRLDKISVLTQNEEDTILSVVSADYNCDGRQEIVVGTYGGNLLTFGKNENWELLNETPFQGPIYSLTALKEIDVIPYLLVMCSDSFAVLSPKFAWLEEELKSRMEKLEAQFKET